MIRKVVTMDGAGVIAVEEQPVPEVGPGMALVEVRATLISPGTELGGVAGRRAKPNPDAPKRSFGYSNAGVVVEVGPDSESHPEIAPGARVACTGGGYALHATHAVVPLNLCVPMPEGLDFESAATNHLVATAMHAVRRGEVEIGENWVVVGLGPVGQFSAQILRLGGARVMAVDRLALRCGIAKECGIDRVVNAGEEDPVEAAREFSRGYGMDGGIIAFGGDGTPAFKQIYAMLKQTPDKHKMGRIVIVGGARVDQLYAAGLGNVDVRSSARPGPGYHDPDWERGADYPSVFVQWTTHRNIEECLRFMAEGRLTAKPLITHRVPIEEAPAVCDELIEHPDRALGVILLPA